MGNTRTSLNLKKMQNYLYAKKTDILKLRNILSEGD